MKQRMILDALFKLGLIPASQTFRLSHPSLVMLPAAAHQMLYHAPFIVQRKGRFESLATVAAFVNFRDSVVIAALPVYFERFRCVAVTREKYRTAVEG